MEIMKGFASDNNASVHPEVMAAMDKVNMGHAIAYGDDPMTEMTTRAIRELFGGRGEAFFVFIGTAANTLGLKAATQSFHSVICADTAHIQVDECGAPEKFTGCKLISVPHRGGKLVPEDIRPLLHGFGVEHHSQPKVISITQATELGTVYTPDEVRALADLAHEHGMYLHMDGARLANAVVSLDVPVAAFTVDAGVDILSFGGTKNGMMYGEAVVFFREELAENFKFWRKQGMQLASKMRYISVQFWAMLHNDLWLRNARHANAMARHLANRLKAEVPEVQITQAVEANGVFAIVPPELIEPLRNDFFFYTWDESRHEVRWMASWDTTENEVNAFVKKIKHHLGYEI